MALNDWDNFFLNQKEPEKGCLLALRGIVLKQDPQISPAWKYGMPFFCYKGKMFCYLWVHKKLHQPYLGIVEGKRINHPNLIIEKRSRMKIILFDPKETFLLKQLKRFYSKQSIYIKPG